MCGIAGIMNVSAPGLPSEDLLCRMVSILRHRGPDETGIYLDQSVGLGHSRLSTVCLRDGTQPLANEDETLWIIFDGEIYNYIELRAELVAKGHRFRTDTDTEVILHLYEDHGAACLRKFNGQFAIAIWDSDEHELFLARDRVGIRPLFTTIHNGRFLFASEIKALFLDPSIPRSLDLAALQQIFTCWAPIGKRTVFQGIEQLSPGHYQLLRSGEEPGKPIPYWSIPYYSQEQQWQGSRDEAIDKLRSLLKDSVRLRLRADVPVGAYLSGGLDSSILTSIIAKNFNNRLKTFSLGFEADGFDETAYQTEMVDYLGTDHHRIEVSSQNVRERFADVIWHCEQPLLRTGPVPLFLLSGLVRDHQFKVVLTGEGADELFGGYNIFKEAKVRNFWGRVPESSMRPALIERLYPYLFQNSPQSKIFLKQFFSVSKADLLDPLISHRKRWAMTGKSVKFFHPDVLEALRGVDPVGELQARLPAGFAERDIFARTQWLEMDIFLSNYLLSAQGDRVAMSHSVALRLPYLDHRLIDFAARLPARWKMPGLKEKHILKLAYRGNIPDSICNRLKQPCRSPIGPVFLSKTDHDLRELICFDQVKRTGLFDVKKVQNLFSRQMRSADKQSSELNNMAVVGILSTQLIYENFIERYHGRLVAPVAPDKVVRKIYSCVWHGAQHQLVSHTETYRENV
jgi:asparagine synthase (glutamine-hydrolysing)